MKKQVIVWLKNGMIAKMNALACSANSHHVSLPSTEVELPVLIEVTHEGLTTILDLSGFPDCVVLQFGRDRFFTGASYCRNRSEGAFMVQAQARYFLLMPLPLPYPIQETEEIMIKPLES
ncbi:MAG: hypothetical protein ACK454_07505 [Flavobacteriales bacterium]